MWRDHRIQPWRAAAYAIVLPAGGTGTSGPACGNNTSPPRTTPFPRQKQTKLGNNHLNSAVARRAARAHNHFPSRETSQPTPTGTAQKNNPGCLPTNSTSQPPPTSTFTLWEVKPCARGGRWFCRSARRAHRRPDKDVLALRADQKDAHHATVGIILSSA